MYKKIVIRTERGPEIYKFVINNAASPWDIEDTISIAMLGN